MAIDGEEARLLIELAVVLGCLVVGARVGGAGLGAVSGLGVAVLVFGFGERPGEPPVDVLFMIISVVAAAAALQAAGGLDYMVHLAARALRASPRHVTLVAPAVAYLFTFCAGTGHVVYALLPVIAETARRAGVRPERPMSVAVIASQQAITASPISAATVFMVGLLNDKGIGLPQILAVCVPSTFLGCMLAALAMFRRGKELHEDPHAQVDAASPPSAAGEPAPDGATRRARASVLVFLSAAALIVVLGLAEGLRPSFDDGEGGRKPMRMPDVVQVVMLSAAAVLVLGFGASPARAAAGSIARAGAVAVVVILGVAWLGNTFFKANEALIVSSIADFVREHPWIFALGLFGLSVLLFSQAATATALMPIGMQIGVPPGALVAMFPAVNGNFFLPAYGTVIAAIAFDPTGTTRIGRFLLNHSFMLPGLVATTSAVAIGFAIARWVL